MWPNQHVHLKAIKPEIFIIHIGQVLRPGERVAGPIHPVHPPRHARIRVFGPEQELRTTGQCSAGLIYYRLLTATETMFFLTMNADCRYGRITTVSSTTQTSP